MKFTVTLKCPDALDMAIEDCAEGEIGGPPNSPAHDVLYAALVERTKRACRKWFKYGELVTLAIDTEAETCIVEQA